MDEKTVEVDGHRFRVCPRPADPGTYDLAWETGTPGYGFTVASARRALTHDEIESAIREFLAQVDPDTGYIE